MFTTRRPAVIGRQSRHVVLVFAALLAVGMTPGAPVATAAGRPRPPVADRLVWPHAQPHAIYRTTAPRFPEAPQLDDPFTDLHME
jgi:hypothetical protein